MTGARFSHIAACDTLPKLVRHNARAHGAEIAQREKEHGIWKTQTWGAVEERVRLWAFGLQSLDVGPGDTVAIVGDSRPDWVAAAVGTHALRAKTLGLYQDALDTEIGYLLAFAEAKVVVAEDEEQVDKIIRVTANVPSVKAIVYNDPRGMRKYDDPRLVSRDALFERTAQAAGDRARWDALADATRGDETAVLCSTSGTTSNPKLVQIAAGPFIHHAANYCDLLEIGPGDDYVSMLPMGWIGEQCMGLFQPMTARYTVNFVEDASTMMADVREIAPTFMFLAPRVWEQIVANVRAQMMDASPFKQKAFEWALKTGLAAVDKGRSSRLAQLTVMRALRDRLGFSRLRFASTGGAAMGPDTFKLFMAMGVPMLQLYGQTELLGIYCTQRPGDRDFDGVGVGLTKAYEVRIDKPDPSGVGEIVSRHPFMFQGYLKNEEATRADIRDGWMHTGDAGYFKSPTQLVVIDRLKDLASTNAGERFSPQYIENKLKFSPYISEAVILGNARDYLTAIICIRYAIVSKWAEQRGMSFTTYSDLASRREVIELVAGEIERVNTSLPEAQRLKKFLLLYKELDADDGELTRTRKVRRGVISEKYADLVDGLYSGADAVKIDTEITFQDGSRQRIRTSLPVASLPLAGARAPATSSPQRRTA